MRIPETGALDASRLPWRAAVIVVLTLAAVAAALLLPPMAQPLDYHAFADTRAHAGIPNFGDVVSNVAFAIAGGLGLAVACARRTVFATSVERVAYVVFFIGILLTAFGSAYYHLAPDNARLVADRLPMTIAFAGLMAGQVSDRTHSRAGLPVLVVSLIAGIGSVVYWRATELAGQGNVLPYAIVQAYAMALLIVLAIGFPSRYTHGSDVAWVFVLYALAKVAEMLDRPILVLTRWLSGHTLKHLLAAAAAFAVVVLLHRRRLRATG